MKQNSNSCYTITGFSKSFFGYCSNWIFCDLGKGECFYNEKDPEAKLYCQAYQRNRKGGQSITQTQELSEFIEPEVLSPLTDTNEVVIEIEEENDEPKQLTLF
ncbi:hypothetical protein [Metabacillus fastidiosus]|uniref:hypothetical protein n=1 Tax=Metabacillus fastidiosus TaxID=1458 RepID=UPI003D2E2819